ncbi:MAG: MerR family transcriptional regulator [Alphaproteobacteria bacterium]|nr:MerR family transcriptional regulator [Alphaproteobacteria bacterium]
MPERTIGEIARLTGVTVRTLHHWEDEGLLAPSRNRANGYRSYDQADLDRLHAILTWRTLGFPLDEIRQLLDDPAGDPLETLRLQRARLVEQLGGINARIAAVDAAIQRRIEGVPLEDTDLTVLFEGFDPAAYEAEVAERWGDTEAFAESQRRTSRYTKADWAAMREDLARVEARLAELLRAGVAPGHPDALQAAEAHRQHISRWFYDCTPEIHAGLGEMYADDPRFAAHYDALAPGLAVFVREAIRALHTPRGKAL